MTIWKFPFQVDDIVTIQCPKGSQPISVLTQRSTPCIWMIVDPKAALVKRQFNVYGTGHVMREIQTGRFMGTIQIHEEYLAFHVFDMGEVE